MADSGFPRGVGANSPGGGGGGAPTHDLSNFPQNCTKPKERGCPGKGTRPSRTP